MDQIVPDSDSINLQNFVCMMINHRVPECGKFLDLMSFSRKFVN